MRNGARRVARPVRVTYKEEMRDEGRTDAPCRGACVFPRSRGAGLSCRGYPSFTSAASRATGFPASSSMGSDTVMHGAPEACET